jgi:hypothetical protein
MLTGMKDKYKGCILGRLTVLSAIVIRELVNIREMKSRVSPVSHLVKFSKRVREVTREGVRG